MINKFTKYFPYLSIKHSWDGINCLTLIEDIYAKQLNISFEDTWKRLNRVNGTDDMNRNWFKIYGLEIIEKEIQNWIKISLQEIEEYDIIIFVKKDIPIHFGLYIAQNKFIHIHEKSYCTFSELDDNYRNMMKGIYRHEKMV